MSVFSQVVHIGPCHLEIPARCGGAVERRMWELAKQQVRSGHEVRLFSIGERDEDEWLEGVLVSRIRVEGASRLRAIRFLRKCASRLKASDALLHFHNVPEAAWVFRRHTNVCLLAFDFPRFGWGRKTPLFFVYRWCLQRFDLLLPVSEFCRRTSARYWLLPEERFHVVHNGVNLRQFCPCGKMRTRFRRGQKMEDATVLAYAGRVNLQKGTDLLMDSFGDLKGRFPQLRLLVCGPPEQFGRGFETKLTRRITEAGGCYLGAISEEELVAFYNAADVLVVPTRRDEMFGMVAAEAQACGAAVIASDSGGLPEVISAKSGRIFRSGHRGSLTDALAAVLEDVELLAGYRQHARENAGRFAWEKVASDLEAAYAEAGRRSRGLPAGTVPGAAP